jgi:hypothetical protein
MKTIQIFIGFILLSTFGIYAQNIMYGISAGLDVANEQYIGNKTYPNESLSPMISYNANAYIGYKSQGYWGLSIEPGFMQKGYMLHYANNNMRIKCNYLQMPIFVNIYFTDKLFISAGPEIAYFLWNRYAYVLKGRNNLELSGLIGINYNISKKIDIGLRYNHGITSISTMTKLYNQYFQLLLRIKFKD